jgi:hypothetical protein
LKGKVETIDALGGEVIPLLVAPTEERPSKRPRIDTADSTTTEELGVTTVAPVEGEASQPTGLGQTEDSVALSQELIEKVKEKRKRKKETFEPTDLTMEGDEADLSNTFVQTEKVYAFFFNKLIYFRCAISSRENDF